MVDIDSEHANTFDTDDQAGLERLVGWFAGAQRSYEAGITTA